MEQGFYITWDVIVKIGAILSALAIIVSFIIKGIHWLDKQDKQTEDIEALKTKHNNDISAIGKERTILTYGTLACLKGLKEKGCNGPVTEAITKIETHLNKKAHDVDENNKK